MARKKAKTDKRDDAPVDEDDHLDAQLFKEVDEEIRRDRYSQIWKSYGKYILGGVAAIVLTTAAVVFWQRYQISVAGKEGEAYAAAVSLAQAGKTEEAIKALAAAAANSGSGYKTMARFQEAALRARKGEARKAAALYDAIAADGDADAILRDLARLLSVMTELDTGKPAELTAKIAPLANGDGPWHHSALELTALLAQKSGNIKRAREIFTRLADDATAPNALRARARALLGSLGGS
ncbi:MAG: tetratricopeptide repeat protein [Alphaproteobacteria bacterium]|nr:tetratricopeptide repeat protein [Alphaproteobacteria bacterium]